MAESTTVPPHWPTPGLSLQCRSCRAEFRVRDLPDGSWRCLSCRAWVLERPSQERWLYPIASRDSSAPTAATLDPGVSPAEAAAPRTIDRYELRGELGRGGMGVVYDALDPVLGRGVALKVLLGGRFASARAIERFRREARATAALEHPHIVEILDFGECDEQPYLTMRKVDGASLSDIVAQHGPLPIAEAVRLASQIASAIHHAHQAGVVHRDLKPANVLVDALGRAAVTDFGLAKQVADTSALTETAMVLGTPGFLAPEVARATPQLDWVRAEVYSLGALLHFLLVGAPPVEGQSSGEQLYAATRGPRIPARAVRPEIGDGLHAVLDVAMRLEPAQRYPDIATFADDLERLRSGETVLARPETGLARGLRWLRARRTAVLVATIPLMGAMLVPTLREHRAAAAREHAAEQAWADVQQRMDALPAESESLFTEFAEADEHARTSALTRAWLARGDSAPVPLRSWHAVLPEEDPALSAWGLALVEAPTEALRVSAMLRIASSTAELTDPSYLDTIVSWLAERRVDGDEGDALLALRLRRALVVGDLEEAAAMWDACAERGLPIAETLADPRWLPSIWPGGLRTELTGEALTTLQQTVDGPQHLLLATGDTWSLHALEPGLPTVDSLHRGVTVNALFPLAPTLGRPGAVYDDRDLVPRHWTPEGLMPWSGPTVASSVVVDLDQDGIAEAYVGSRDRSLLRLHDDGSHDDLTPWSAAERSDLTAMTAGDIDGDGTPELVVGLGAWVAYDVRVLEHHEGGLRERARLDGNAPYWATLMEDPWGKGSLIVTADTDRYANVRVFGAERPSGPPPAITVRRLVGDTLQEVWRLEIPRLVGVRNPTVADLDGDGRDELVICQDATSNHAQTLVLRATETDHFEVAMLAGMCVQATTELDGDATPEFFALQSNGITPQAVWVLGQGTDALPQPVLAPGPQLPPAPPGTPEGLQAAWDSSALLARSRLPQMAAAGLERISAIASPSVGIVAARSAASLLDAAGRPMQGAAAWKRAAAYRLGTPDDVAAAVEAYLASADPVAALSIPGATHPRLSPWRAARQHELRWAADGLHPSTRVQQPAAFEVGPEGLVTHWTGSGMPMATVPFRVQTDAVAVQLDMRLERADWGAMARIQLDLGGELHHVRLQMRGGGGIYHLTLWIEPPDGPLIAAASIPVPRLPEDTPMAVRIAYDAELQDWVYAVTLGERFDVARRDGPPPDKSLPSSLHLADDGPHVGAMGLAIEELRLWGVEVGTASTTPLDQARRHLVDQRPREALALLPADAHVDRATAHAMLFDSTAALASLRAAGPDSLQRALPYLLRVRRTQFVPLLQQLLGPDYATAFHRVWSESLGSGGHRDTLLDALWHDLVPVDWPHTPDDLRWSLLASRAASLLEHGRPAQGRDEAVVWLERHDNANGIWTDHASTLHGLLAALSCAGGQAEEARAHAAQALALSSRPDLVRRRLQRAEDFSPCNGDTPQAP